MSNDQLSPQTNSESEFMRDEGENGPQGEAYEKEPGSF